MHIYNNIDDSSSQSLYDGDLNALSYYDPETGDWIEIAEEKPEPKEEPLPYWKTKYGEDWSEDGINFSTKLYPDDKDRIAESERYSFSDYEASIITDLFYCEREPEDKCFFNKAVCITSIFTDMTGEKHHQQRIIRVSELKEFLTKTRFSKAVDFYIHTHFFPDYGWRRKQESIKGLKNIMFDIDQVKHHDYSDPEELYQEKKAMAEKLWANLRHKPSMIVITGGGVQLWYNIREIPYIYKEKQQKAQETYNMARYALRKEIEEVIKDSKKFKLDSGADCFSHVGRLPGSFHTKSKTFTEIFSVDRDYYSWYSADMIIMDAKKYITFPVQPEKKAKKTSEHTGKHHEAEDLSKRKAEGGYKPLLSKRERMIMDGIAVGDLGDKGSREMTLFLFYNNERQINESTAREKTLLLNRSLPEPLNEAELEHVFNQEKTYHFTTETFCEKLYGSDAEGMKKAAAAQATHRAAQNFKRDLERQIKKQTRNARILLLHKEGKSQREIEKETGIARNTISKIIKEEEGKQQKLEAALAMKEDEKEEVVSA